jgi:hypothetical protein
MSRPREPHATRDKLNITITVPRDTLAYLEEEAKREGSRLSAYFLHAMDAYLAAPQFGGRRILPSTGFVVLQVGEDHCFVPRNWTTDDLRRAAEVLAVQSHQETTR